jgi:hypothetical protein
MKVIYMMCTLLLLPKEQYEALPTTGVVKTLKDNTQYVIFEEPSVTQKPK